MFSVPKTPTDSKYLIKDDSIGPPVKQKCSYIKNVLNDKYAIWDGYLYKSDDTFEIKFARHVSVVQRPSSVESRINLKLHLNL